jgi:hypoxanthine phosphoribosyltransferase
MDTTKKNPPRVLISEAELQRRVKEMAGEIDRDYADSDSLVAIGVLKGSVFFLVDLLKHVTVPVAVDFFQTTSYGSGTKAGEVRIRKDIDLSIRGKDVLLVEDIVDTGLTLSYLLGVLDSRQPASVAICTLLDKSVRRITPLDIRYVGFDCPDVFVVGYGLDVGERYRNVPDILAIGDVAAITADPDLLLPFVLGDADGSS